MASVTTCLVVLKEAIVVLTVLTVSSVKWNLATPNWNLGGEAYIPLFPATKTSFSGKVPAATMLVTKPRSKQRWVSGTRS